MFKGIYPLSFVWIRSAQSGYRWGTNLQIARRAEGLLRPERNQNTRTHVLRSSASEIKSSKPRLQNMLLSPCNKRLKPAGHQLQRHPVSLPRMPQVARNPLRDAERSEHAPLGIKAASRLRAEGSPSLSAPPRRASPSGQSLKQ